MATMVNATAAWADRIEAVNSIVDELSRPTIEMGRPWDERLRTWVGDSGCDVWVVQREVLDPAEFVELWLRDASERARKTGKPQYSSPTATSGFSAPALDYHVPLLISP